MSRRKARNNREYASAAQEEEMNPYNNLKQKVHTIQTSNDNLRKQIVNPPAAVGTYDASDDESSGSFDLENDDNTGDVQDPRAMQKLGFEPMDMTPRNSIAITTVSQGRLAGLDYSDDNSGDDDNPDNDNNSEDDADDGKIQCYEVEGV